MEARRAAAPEAYIEEIEPTRAPRRAQGSRVRAFVVPLAMVAVTGAFGAALVLPGAANRTVPIEPSTGGAQASAQQLSRDSARVNLAPATPISTPSPTSVPDVAPVSSSAAPSATTEASVSAKKSTSAEASQTTPTKTAKAAAAKAAKPAPSDSATATKSATASAEASPSAEAKQAEVPKLGEDGDKAYATASVNVRTGPATEFASLTVLSQGDAVVTTDVKVDGWQQINRDGEAGWVKASYLSDEPVEAAEDTSAASNAKCSKAGDLESHLTERTRGVLRAICAKFPNVSSYGGYRAGSGGYHGSGQAIDVMISGDAGWDIAKWARSNASDLGVIEVIYEQKIWTTQRSGDGWRSMSDRGSKTANHYDHVHVSVR